MKGYEDLAAGLMLLAVVLTGGYFYLNSQVIDQKKVEHKVKEVPRPKIDLSKFEAAVKRTD
jgi:hypothetical protein